jgi:hypothetical protein
VERRATSPLYYLLVVVAGGLSLSFGVGGTGDVGFPVMFCPSAPLLGSGVGPGIPRSAGLSDLFSGGCLIAGGAF